MSKNTVFKYIISVAILIIAISVAYYFFVFLPEKEKSAIQRYNQEKTDECIDEEIASILKRYDEVVYNWNGDRESQKETLQLIADEIPKRQQTCADKFGGEIR